MEKEMCLHRKQAFPRKRSLGIDLVTQEFTSVSFCLHSTIVIKKFMALPPSAVRFWFCKRGNNF